MSGGLGAFLRARRTSLGLRIEDAATLAGVTWSYWANIENGRQHRFPTPAQLRGMATALQVTPLALLEAAGYLDPDP